MASQTLWDSFAVGFVLRVTMI